MPPPEIREEQRVLGEATVKSKKAPAKKKPSQVTEQDMLLDLMGDLNEPAADRSATLNGSSNNADLLADILGGGSSTSSPPPQTTSPPPSNAHANIMDLFNSSGPPASSSPAPSQDLFGGMNGLSSPPPQNTFSSPPPQQQPLQGQEAYNKNGLQISLQTRRDANAVQILARFRNSGSGGLSQVALQAAVPKSQKLQLQAISSSDLGPGATATQQMKVGSVSGVSCFPSLTCEYRTDVEIATTCEVTLAIENSLLKWRRCVDAGPGRLVGECMRRARKPGIEEDIIVIVAIIYLCTSRPRCC
jgi:AP-1 complex subunit gamma-1